MKDFLLSFLTYGVIPLIGFIGAVITVRTFIYNVSYAWFTGKNDGQNGRKKGIFV